MCHSLLCLILQHTQKKKKKMAHLNPEGPPRQVTSLFPLYWSGVQFLFCGQRNKSRYWYWVKKFYFFSTEYFLFSGILTFLYYFIHRWYVLLSFFHFFSLWFYHLIIEVIHFHDCWCQPLQDIVVISKHYEITILILFILFVCVLRALCVRSWLVSWADKEDYIALDFWDKLRRRRMSTQVFLKTFLQG